MLDFQLLHRILPNLGAPGRIVSNPVTADTIGQDSFTGSAKLLYKRHTQLPLQRLDFLFPFFQLGFFF